MKVKSDTPLGSPQIAPSVGSGKFISSESFKRDTETGGEEHYKTPVAGLNHASSHEDWGQFYEEHTRLAKLEQVREEEARLVKELVAKKKSICTPEVPRLHTLAASEHRVYVHEPLQPVIRIVDRPPAPVVQRPLSALSQSHRSRPVATALTVPQTSMKGAQTALLQQKEMQLSLSVPREKVSQSEFLHDRPRAQTPAVHSGGLWQAPEKSLGRHELLKEKRWAAGDYKPRASSQLARQQGKPTGAVPQSIPAQTSVAPDPGNKSGLPIHASFLSNKMRRKAYTAFSTLMGERL